MLLIVGLGNPGKKYENTRHNIGSKVINKLEFLNLKNVILKKPTVFMNESGRAMKTLIKTYNIKPKNLIIIHDDLDLLFGRIKISVNRGAAGHKGVESIIKELKTKNFVRFRIGIKPKNNEQRTKNNINVKKFVLEKFSKDEKKIVKKLIKKTAEVIEFAIKQGIEKAMNKYN
jgi:PTH1 family peptidyl-tRNA hydrolase